MDYRHEPVMLKEVMDFLRVQSGDTVVDCTLGGGGYTNVISQTVGDSGTVLAIDADEMAIRNAEFKIQNSELGQNIILAHDNFRNLKKIIEKNQLQEIRAIVFDCGLSSAQLQDRTRGFSFELDAPLNMSFGIHPPAGEAGHIATEDIINKWQLEKLKEIIRNYGEERFAGRIASAIVRNRLFFRTKELANAIRAAVPNNYERGRIDPATRTFQALRIATNDELASLQEGLAAAVDALAAGGRVVVVSFHSLEDRIVKQLFKREASACVCPPEVLQCVCNHQPRLKILTKKVVAATAAEIARNPRARSAKLRAAEKLNF
ncbi:16S rRNA (cytosine(1402)-N(4))-methyltransferase [Candidatus Falkowbacteria bacterium RIFOXYC2_FULL_47_12]|uniref:Ribosomal RNA small subunit methyltransferase H n=2 Tax=Candidatus Falkowiibacteriota TaxID=1752728 RepID=A0A1F5TQU3_9BACT|nr:MAG: 16S rRNA (cytosine(1402)-N(4))-methyltransferase [Candidatus Falkowbacteria bacterium RIFOXYA2_FULL_47_9]OGF41392.1 MAG: 16S rRNA (cytosine(1402)-N(4))-methyltransferase [Candidatus Falkowbacteria bacterium RIFOXYC2_FULL_47_12]